MAISAPSAQRADLPAEPTQAQRFGKARTAQSGALSEDYVELISDLLANGGEARPTDMARRLGVSHATAIKTIGRLKREGLAVAKPYRGVFLTEFGRKTGRAGAEPSQAGGGPAGGRRGSRRDGRTGRRGHRAPCVRYKPVHFFRETDQLWTILSAPPYMVG